MALTGMETGAFISDETREFHYRDVLSVATSSDRIVLYAARRPLQAGRAGTG